jgi:predicted phage terminase large subunit-like protein
MSLDFDIGSALKNLDRLKPEDKQRVIELLDERERLHKVEKAREHFIEFVKLVWPGFIPGPHHYIMAEAFERVAKGECKRLIINMAPRHTKSELTSWLLPAWFLGKFPRKKIIQASNTEALAAGFGRRVRNLISGSADEDDDGNRGISYSEIFPRVELAKDSQSAAGWHTNKGGEYFAIGISGKVTGKGGDVVIIDDPHSEQEARQAETSPEIFDNVYEWYTSGPRQRLQPGGSIIVVMCMTGDTLVLRPDGTETPLAEIKVGDEVATYEHGSITTSRVSGWRSNGVDDIFAVQLRSGKVLKANARHPFLVSFAGERKWVRLEDLTPGMSLVATRAATDPHDLKPNPVFATRVRPGLHIIESTPTRRTTSPATTEKTKAGPAQPAKNTRFTPKGFVLSAIANSTRRLFTRLNKIGRGASSIDTASHRLNTRQWWRSAKAAATSAVSFLLDKILVLTGMGSYVSTTAMTQVGSVACYATTVTSPSGTERRQLFLKAQPSICDVTLDEVVSITPAGREEVFDLEIERTENFIANGVVSHNTRWSKRDLTGQVLKKMASLEEDEYGDRWEVIEFPAILDEDTPEERALWPAFWSLPELRATKAVLPVAKWKAQYQQNPTSEEGAIIKREAWRRWGSDKEECPADHLMSAWNNLEPPPCEFIMMSIDTALKKNERADYSAFTTWGVFKVDDPKTGLPINNLILLSAWKARLEFPELKKKVLQFHTEDQPDTLLIEDKGSGISLIQELRSMGVPVENFSYGRGSKKVSNDKVARANMVADIFASGYVWAPERRFADECIEECAEFPYGDHDDYLDTVVQALLRFRSGGLIRTASDEPDDWDEPRSYRSKRYY